MTQTELDDYLAAKTAADQLDKRWELAKAIIAANSAQFFRDVGQEGVNQHMTEMQFANKCFDIAEQALVAERTLQHEN